MAQHIDPCRRDYIEDLDAFMSTARTPGILCGGHHQVCIQRIELEGMALENFSEVRADEALLARQPQEVDDAFLRGKICTGKPPSLFLVDINPLEPSALFAEFLQQRYG